ncbi:unnamed protein product [Protopolystoma xenopodis]|uniref:Uncharacterized protein n=1 Tax=Protopolystoma xenopodis TaxID=117903 RepID=A0A3S4ZU40_9PLAT|nr:unnamed protein product [Protopolystoma xenopodis]
MFKVMEGLELGCTDLHLACGDTVLVGQVADEGALTSLQHIATEAGLKRIKRLQENEQM